jgi:hypothetical protein
MVKKKRVYTIAPLFALLSRLSWVISFTPRPYYPREQNHPYSSDINLSLSLSLSLSLILWVCLGIKHPSGAYDQIFITVRHLRIFYMGRSPCREDWSVVYNCSWPSPLQSFWGPTPVGLVTIFYCLRFETSIFVASYDLHGYGGGIRPRLHTGLWIEIEVGGP